MILSQLKGAVGDPRQTNARTDNLSHRASSPYLLGVVISKVVISRRLPHKRRQNPDGEHAG